MLFQFWFQRANHIVILNLTRELSCDDMNNIVGQIASLNFA